MNAPPNPHARWPKLAGADLSWQAALRRALTGMDWGAAVTACEALLGTHIRTSGPTIDALTAEAMATRWTGRAVALALEDVDVGTASVVVLEVPNALARVIVDRALGGEGALDTGLDALAPAMDDVSQGVLAYVVAHALAATQSSYKLRDATVAIDTAQRWLGDAPRAVVTIPITLGGCRDVIRLWMNDTSVRHLVASAPTPTTTAAQHVPVPLRAVAANDQLRLGEIAALDHGDIVMLSACALRLSENVWSGALRLYVGERSDTWFTCGTDGHALTITDPIQRITAYQTTGAHTVSEPSNASEVDLRMLADVTVEIEVELARFTLTVAQISALQAGDVLRAGEPIGARVQLRAGGQTLAEAELVDVDGEVGVRVLRLLRGAHNG